MLGDVDNNGRVQTADAIYIARYLVGHIDLNGNAAFYADTDDLGSVRNADAIMVARYLVGLTDDNFQPL